ncbi:MAG: GTA-gp10 family protein [Pseudomonadota bacterium]
MNFARGEVALVVDGVERRLCLTLGALAEIQVGLGCTSLADVAARIGSLDGDGIGRVLSALLRGGGEVELAGQLVSPRSHWIDLGIEPGAAANAIACAFETAFVEL